MDISEIGIVEILKTQIYQKFKFFSEFFFWIFFYLSKIVFSSIYILKFRFIILYIGSLWLKLATKSLKYYMHINFAIMEKISRVIKKWDDGNTIEIHLDKSCKTQYCAFYTVRVLHLKKSPIIKLNPMLLTSLLHGAPQLKHEARNTLKGINPLWDF